LAQEFGSSMRAFLTDLLFLPALTASGLNCGMASKRILVTFVSDTM